MSSPETQDPAARGGNSRLVPTYTFEEFVVGPHNRFPHAAALAVSENLGKAYNPLFLYGPVGIGKTHLMQSVGHRVLERNPQAHVLYVTAQHYMSEVIELLQAGKLQSLRERYRSLDLLLVDDIQFLATSEATQEEFFHMFNDLHAGGKQIIMTSDRPPKMLTTLEDRLRSRFEWGLIADIKFTNLETRVAILKKKESHIQGIRLEDDIRLYIASRLKSNIRELEGFLRRIQAYTQLYNQEISLPVVKEILRELLPPEEWLEEDEEEISPASPQKVESSKVQRDVPQASSAAPKGSEGFDIGPHMAGSGRSQESPNAGEGDVKKATRQSHFTEIDLDISPVPPAPPPVVSAPNEKEEKIPVEPCRPAEEEKTPASPAASPPPILPTSQQRSPSPTPPPPVLPTPPEEIAPAPPSATLNPPPPSSMPKPTEIITPVAPPPSLPKPPLVPLPVQPLVGGPKKSAPVNFGVVTGSSQIPVVFFYPLGHDKELVLMKKKFDDIISKHKLKFTLNPAAEVDYPQSTSFSAETFVEKCREAGVTVAVVLGPPSSESLQEGVFFGRLQEAFEQAQLSLQMVPWDELSKDYRFLNLALDITLIRIKQRK